MNGELVEWVRSSCHYYKAESLIKTMRLLLTTMDPSIEEMWLMYMGKVGIGNNQATFDNLQQLLLDSTIQSLEQYSIQIVEHVDFSDQSALTRLLESMQKMDRSELSNEFRSILSSDIDNLDKLLECIKIVAEDPFEDFSSYIEDFSVGLLDSLKQVYSSPEFVDDAADMTTPDILRLRKYIVELTGEDEILEFARNTTHISYDFAQVLALMSGSLLALEDPYLFVTRLITLYLASKHVEGGDMQLELSNFISQYSNVGTTELESLELLKQEMRKI